MSGLTGDGGRSRVENGRKPSITGVVLAGGSNRRMDGKMKALLRLNGELFIERQLAEMSAVCQEILIIANEPSLFEQQLVWSETHVRIVPDLQAGKGPMAGLQAAMAAAQHDELWVVACDMPCISAAAAEALMELRRSSGRDGHDAAVPQLKGRLQPLHAVYHRRCIDAVGELLTQSRHRMTELLDVLDYAAADDQFFTGRGLSVGFTENVNTPEELENLRSQT